MPVTNTTANYGFPLPNGANKLKDDILRLIDAIVAIDANEAALAALLAGKAPLNGPVFINPQGTTQAGSDNSTKLATTAFVKTALAALVGSSPATLDTLNEIATALGNDPNFATTIMNALATKANATTTYSKTEVDGLLGTVVPAGVSIMHNGRTAPTGYLKENGAAYSRATYAALFAAITSSATVTISISTPGVVTWNNHGLPANYPVRFSTTGALPTGLVAGTTYYVISGGLTANTFQVSATVGGAAINTSGSQSGVHTALSAPHGYGDGSTTFNVPDSRAEFPRGLDDGRGIDVGRVIGSAQADAFQGHFHSSNGLAGSVAALGASAGGNVYSGTGLITGPTTDGVNGTPRTAAETRPRNTAKLFCIKF